ncbi:sigma-70 family RNA polymerase sigma factor [Candidatus Hydrogenedentota bacterium]
MSLHSEEQLVNDARAGDSAAFGLLVRRHYDSVYGLAFSGVGERTAAEDIAQETFIAAWCNFGKLKSPKAFAGWLRRIVRNLSVSWIRSAQSRRKLRERYEIETASSHDTVGNAIADEGRTAQVNRALSALSPKLRDALVLFYLKEESITEAAHSLGITKHAMKARLHQGRKKLKDRLMAQWEAELRTEIEPMDSAKASKRVLSGIALGPALPSIADAATSTGIKSSIQKMVSKTVSSTPKPLAIGGIAAMNMKKAMILAGAVLLLLAAGHLSGIFGSSLSEETSSGPTSSNEPVGSAMESPAVVYQGPGSEESAPENGPVKSPVAAPVEVVVASEEVLTSIEPAPEPGRIEDPAEYCSISGLVRDAEGNPVPGARVWIIASGLKRDDPLAVAKGLYQKVGYDRSHHFHGTSGESGEYLVEGVTFSGRASIRAVAQGSMGKRYLTLRAGDRLENVNIEMSPGVMTNGRIYAHDGAAVTDAVVKVDGIVGPGFARGGGSSLAYTGIDGTFSLCVERAGTVALSVISESRGAFTTSPLEVDGESDLEAFLPEPAEIRGRITWSDGACAAGTKVVLSGEMTLQYVTEQGRNTSGATTAKHGISAMDVNANGEYVLENVDPGLTTYTIQIVRSDYTPLSGELRLGSLVPGELKTWNHVLGSIAEVSGHVYGEKSGNPLKNLRIRIWKVDASVEPIVTDVGEDGSYEVFLAAGPGLYRFAPEFKYALPESSDRYEIEVMLSSGHNPDVDLIFADPVTLSLRAVDSEGAPISDAEILFQVSSGGGTTSYGTSNHTDDSGNFTWSGFAPETEYTLVVETDQHVGTAAGPFTGEPGAVFPQETVVLYKVSGATGVLLTPEGGPVADRNLTVNARNDAGTAWEVHEKANEEGAFIIRNELPATTVALEITARLGRRKLRWTCDEVEFNPGEIMDLGELVLDEVETSDTRSVRR